MKGKLYLLLSLLTLYHSLLDAQLLPGQILTNYNSENGLPQNSAKMPKIDKDGFIWTGTEMGLVRFDGSRFRAYNRNNSPIENDRIFQVSLDHDRSIYLWDEKRLRYRLNAGRHIERYGPGDGKFANLSSKGFLDVRRLWKYPTNKGLEKKVAASKDSHTYFLISGDTTTGFFFFDGMRYFAYLKNYQCLWIDSLFAPLLENVGITACYEGKLYYIDRKRNLIQIDSAGKSERITLTDNRYPAEAQTTPRVSSLMQDIDKMFCRVGNEIWRLTKKDEHSFSGQPVLDLSGIPGFRNIVCDDKLGILVAGSETNGLYIARTSPFQVQKAPAGTPGAMYAQVPMPGSSVLTYQGVLPAGEQTLKIPANELFTLFLFRDNRNHYWMEKHDSLFELNERLQIVRKLVSGIGPVQCMQQTPDGTCWLSSNAAILGKFSFGKIIGDSVAWIYTNTTKNYNETFIALDNQRFLLGNKYGLQEFDVQKRSVKDYPQLAGAYVRSIYKDRNGIIWIGTYGQGFYALYKNRFIKFPLDRRAYLSTAHSFMEDKNGFLWVPTNNGLFQLKMDDLYAYLRDTTVDLYYHYYGKSDGLPTNEFNGGCNPAGIELENGKFSLPSMEGLVQFHPDSIHPILPGTEIFIDEIMIDSSLVTDLSKLKLGPSFNRISISISSPYYGNPYNQYIEYNLKGLDEHWYPVSENNTIIFNRLRHGSYELQLRKKAGFGLNNYLSTRLPFAVQPGFTDTWMFKILLVVPALLLFYFSMKFRYRFLVKKKRQLEAEVQARTAQQQELIGTLRSTVLELEQSREELFYNNRFKEKLALLITHDLQSPLRFLSVMCDQLHEKAFLTSHQEIRDGSIEIRNTVREIHAFVEEFGLWTTTQQEDFRINTSRFALGPLMMELQKFFKEMMQQKGNALILDIDPDIRLSTDRQLLKIVLRNLIDNANKHTSNGTIMVGLAIQGNKAILRVSDNGRGVPVKELEKIRTRMKNATRSTILDKDSRLGYQLIIDFVMRLGAELSLESLPDEGATITIGNFEYHLEGSTQDQTVITP